MKPSLPLTLTGVGNVLIQEMTYRQVQKLAAAQAAVQQEGYDATPQILEVIRPTVVLPKGVTCLEDLPMSDLQAVIHAVGEMHGFFPAAAPPPGSPSSL